MDLYETWIMGTMSGGETQTFEAYSTEEVSYYPKD